MDGAAPDGAAPAGARVAAAVDPAVRCASRSRAASVTRREKSPSVRPSDQAPGPGASVLDSAAAHCAPPPFDVVDTIMRAHSPASPGRTPGPYGRRAASGLGVARWWRCGGGMHFFLETGLYLLL